jgi:hypothetical protein
MFSQLFIAITGVIAIWFSQDERPNIKKYACLFGLAGQPCWFYTTFVEEQWGIFALTFVYTAAWCKGIYLYWIKPRRKGAHQ